LNTKDIHPGESHRLAVRLNTTEYPSMRARHGPADDRVELVNNQVINNDAQIGEGAMEHANNLLFPRKTRRLTSETHVIHKVRSIQLIQCRLVPAVPDGNPATCNRDILLGRH